MTQPAYMPFTHLSEPTAQILSTLVGPLVIYQPIKRPVAERLTRLALSAEPANVKPDDKRPSASVRHTLIGLLEACG